MAFINGQKVLFSAMINRSDAIIDCETLPTQDINAKSFYRTPDGIYWHDGEWHKVIEDDDIVVPDTNTSERGTAGLVHMYNESSGLRLDPDKRICIASATNDEVTAGVSFNKPIVPAVMKHAVRVNSYKDDLAQIDASSEDANTPAGAFAVKDFVLKNALNFKLHKIPRGGTIEVTPGMMALILPYGDYTLSAHKADGTTVASKMGATIVMATDWGADEHDANNYWVALMYVKSATIMPTMSSNHTSYTDICYIKNNDSGSSGSGFAYVYYIERN